jgi:hypothetical protein
MRALALLFLVLVAFALAGCRQGASGAGADPPEQPASPQAKAEPAPIASLPSPGGSASPQPASLALDGGIVPQPLRADRALLPDTTTKETTKEGIAGYSLVAVFRPSDVPPPAKGAEVLGLEAAHKKTENRLTIDLAPSHARIVLGPGFVLPEGTELRQRIDRYGHIVFIPEEGMYRIAGPGSLRAVLAERRLDVAPLSSPELTHNGEGARRFGRPTHKVEVFTRAAKATFEIGHLAELGEGGTLLCRSLLELMGAPPATPLCSDGDVPLHAELHWTALDASPPKGGAPSPAPGLGSKGRIAGVLTFDVVSVTHRMDLAAASLAVPPPQASFLEAPFRPERARLLLAKSDLVALRPAGPEASLALVNSTDELRFAWLDGVPVAWVAPGNRIDVPGLVAGRYGLEWRTFFGDTIEPPQTVALPTTSDLGGSEAAAP